MLIKGPAFIKGNTVCEAEASTDVSGHYLHVVHIAPLYPFEQVPSQTGLKLINLKWQDVLI